MQLAKALEDPDSFASYIDADAISGNESYFIGISCFFVLRCPIIDG